MTYNPLMIHMLCKHMIGRKIGTPTFVKSSVLRDLVQGSRLCVAHNGSLTGPELRKWREWGDNSLMISPVIPDWRAGRRLFYPTLYHALKTSVESDIDASKMTIGDEADFKKRAPLKEVVFAMEDYFVNNVPEMTKDIVHQMWDSLEESAMCLTGELISEPFMPMFEEWSVNNQIKIMVVTDELKAERDANDSWGAW